MVCRGSGKTESDGPPVQTWGLFIGNVAAVAEYRCALSSPVRALAQVRGGADLGAQMSRGLTTRGATRPLAFIGDRPSSGLGCTGSGKPLCWGQDQGAGWAVLRSNRAPACMQPTPSSDTIRRRLSANHTPREGGFRISVW